MNRNRFAMISGRRVDCDYLIGRRFTWSNNAAPDVTFVSAKDGHEGEPGEFLSAHCADGGREWLPFGMVANAVAEGILIESERGVPFVNDGPTLKSCEFVKTYNNTRGFYPGARR